MTRTNDTKIVGVIRRHHATGMTTFRVEYVKLSCPIPVDQKRIKLAIRNRLLVRTNRVDSDSNCPPLLQQGGVITDAHFEHRLFLPWSWFTKSQHIALPEFARNYRRGCAKRQYFHKTTTGNVHNRLRVQA